MSEPAPVPALRRDYTIVLEIVPTAPLTHGMGTEGNAQILLRREWSVPTPDGAETLDVPAVSGAAVKATLREWAVRDYLERAGVPEGRVSRDVLRLLQKGGQTSSGGQTISLAEIRRLRDLCPMLAVFGSMDGGVPIRGAIQVSDATPWIRELVDAGLLPREIRPLRVDLEGRALVQGPPIPIYPGRRPVDLHGTTTEATYYRHDLIGGNLAHYLPAPEVEASEDARAAVAEAKRTKGAPKPDAATRREANEAMPHSFEAIRPGTPMVCTIRLQSATEVEFAVLGISLVRWIASGAHLGGGATKGHGACSVRVAGAISHAPPSGAMPVAPGDPLPALTADFGGEAVARAYDAHVQSRAEAIRAWVAGA